MNGRRRLYALSAVAVFAIEVVIAVFARDGVIRPLLGDSLAVILVYLVLRAATRLGVAAAIALALGLAFAVELGQLFNVVELLGLSGNRIARVVLGARFDPLDLVAYFAGAIVAAAGEALSSKPPLR
jgi:hypothetical protein